jgi:hypothetical protein
MNKSIALKRLLALAGICLVLIGAKVGRGALFDVNIPEARLTVYMQAGHSITMRYHDVHALSHFEGYYAMRIDSTGGIATAESLLKQLGARRLFEQQLQDITIIYAHAPTLRLRVSTHGHIVNIMIAISRDNVAIGYPVLVGSY